MRWVQVFIRALLFRACVFSHESGLAYTHLRKLQDTELPCFSAIPSLFATVPSGPTDGSCLLKLFSEPLVIFPFISSQQGKIFGKKGGPGLEVSKQLDAEMCCGYRHGTSGKPTSKDLFCSLQCGQEGLAEIGVQVGVGPRSVSFIWWREKAGCREDQGTDGVQGNWGIRAFSWTGLAPV